MPKSLSTINPAIKHPKYTKCDATGEGGRGDHQVTMCLERLLYLGSEGHARCRAIGTGIRDTAHCCTGAQRARHTTHQPRAFSSVRLPRSSSALLRPPPPSPLPTASILGASACSPRLHLLASHLHTIYSESRIPSVLKGTCQPGAAACSWASTSIPNLRATSCRPP